MGDPICKWRAATPKNVVFLVSILPHDQLTEQEFKSVIELKMPGFLHTPYQLACQLGLYVVDNGTYTPRFINDISEDTAKQYLESVATRYYVPNPYTPRGFKNIDRPVILEQAIVTALESNPDKKNLEKILESIFSEDIGNLTAIKTLLSYSKVLEFNKMNVRLKPNYKEIMEKQLNRKDKTAFFEFLKGETMPTSTSTLPASYLTAMRTKPFLLLAGISGTGKSRIVKQLAYESCPDKDDLQSDPTSPGNYQLIEVKPNWHDSTEVLGYESEIGGRHYVLTPFVRFLVKAMRYEAVCPFFVCMDEMNLAPVEQYFAEFLSVLESRKVCGTRISSEPLIKAEIFARREYEKRLREELCLPDNCDYNDVYEKLKTDGLRLPSNLIVIGTVNMDETTHQFSRKVIDRAMTIEMNIEDAKTPFQDFFEGGDALHYYENPQPRELFLPKAVQASEVLSQLSEDDAQYIKDNVPQLLYKLNKALNGTPFKIAYRVQNELVLYFYALRQEQPKEEEAEKLLTSAMDAILMMKVLPRIEGDEDLLEKPLKALAEFTADYPQANKKIAEMQIRLPQAHFTSFWP